MQPLDEAKMKIDFLLNKLNFIQEDHKREIATYELRLRTRVQEFAIKTLTQLQ